MSRPFLQLIATRWGTGANLMIDAVAALGRPVFEVLKI